MTLEATVIWYLIEVLLFSLDNSDWGRDGDFIPTRWESIQETVRCLIEEKLRANQESTLGLMTMAGSRVDLLATLCRDDSRLYATIQSIKLGNYLLFDL